MSDRAWLECISCTARFDLDEVRYECDCGGLLSVERPGEWARELTTDVLDQRRAGGDGLDASGVWRFREGVLQVDPNEIVTHPEGSTRLYRREALSRWAGIEDLSFKHEGENPTGSFKDRGMTVAMTQAVRVGASAVACASTGNTSASLAAYAGQAGLPAVVFIPAGKIAMGKLSQTLAYGARCLQIKGDFDSAMNLVREASKELGFYLANSVNPFRIEGQKTIIWELLQDLRWDPPDWIVLPAGNLGNASAFGKALREARDAGWIERLPRLALIQASGANPFFLSFKEGFRTRHRVQAETIASAIRIGDPVSYDRARISLELTNGVVAQVSDEEILKAKSEIDRAGIGCEPASACSLAGARKLRSEGMIKPDEGVVGILTGNLLKDPVPGGVDEGRFAGSLIEIDATIEAVDREMRGE